MSRTVFEFPWECQDLMGWDICGMNHYYVGGVRHLYVSMTQRNVCIKAEGTHPEDVFNSLVVQATAMRTLSGLGSV